MKGHPIFIYNQYPKCSLFYSRILIAEKTKWHNETKRQNNRTKKYAVVQDCEFVTKRVLYKFVILPQAGEECQPALAWTSLHGIAEGEEL